MLRIHHPPVGEATVHDFDVYLDSQQTASWFCRVSAMPYNTVWPGCQRPLDQTEVASFISFEMDQPVQVRLVAARDFSDLAIRPLSKGIEAQVNGREITFTLNHCGQYTVELDGWHNALHIFANPVSDFGVDKADPQVLYFAPGVHDIGDLELADCQTLFVDGGAVLYGSVTAFHKKNIRIVGYGVIDGSREVRTDDTALLAWNFDNVTDLRDESTLRAHLKEHYVLNGCVRLYSCPGCEVSGVIARDSVSFAFILANCERANCDWLKAIGMWRYNSDGIDLFNCRYVRIANCFLRDFDDCVVIKGMKGWDKANQHHITVTGCTIWCDWGRALELGAETCADEYYDILWDDCDLIHGAHVNIDVQNSDRAWIHDMLVRNIRCEYSQYDLRPVIQSDMSAPYTAYDTPWQPTLIATPIYDGPYSYDHILGRTSDVRFEDIQILGPEGMSIPECSFDGKDEIHCTHDVVVENVTCNGRRLKPQELPLRLSEYAHDIIVK